MSTTDTVKRLVAERRTVKRRKWTEEQSLLLEQALETYGFHWPAVLAGLRDSGDPFFDECDAQCIRVCIYSGLEGSCLLR